MTVQVSAWLGPLGVGASMQVHSQKWEHLQNNSQNQKSFFGKCLSAKHLGHVPGKFPGIRLRKRVPIHALIADRNRSFNHLVTLAFLVLQAFHHLLRSGQHRHPLLTNQCWDLEGDQLCTCQNRQPLYSDGHQPNKTVPSADDNLRHVDHMFSGRFSNTVWNSMVRPSLDCRSH